MRHLMVAALLVACSPPDEPANTADTGPITPMPTADTVVEDTAPPDGACGAVSYWPVTLIGVVHNTQGVGAPFAEVWLEERGWHLQDTEMARGFTDSQGAFELQIPALVSVEDCWGTILDYILLAELGPQQGEDQINTWLFTAVDGGTLIADMSTVPLRMEDTSK